MTKRPIETGPRTPAPQPTYETPQRPRRGYQRESLAEAMLKSFIRAIGASLGRVIARVILGRRR